MTLMEISLPVISAILSIAVILFVWYQPKMTDNRFGKWYKRPHRPFWYVLLLSLANIILVSISKCNDVKGNKHLSDVIDSTNKKADSIMNSNKGIKDALNTISIHSDSSGKLFLSTILSSSNGIKGYVRDTLLSGLKSNSPSPQLSLAPIGQHFPFFQDEEGYYKIQFISANATAYHIKIDIYIVDTIRDRMMLKEGVTNDGTFINPGATKTLATKNLNADVLNLSAALIILHGSFSKDEEGKEIIPYIQSFMYNFLIGKEVPGIPVNERKFKSIIKHLSHH